MSVHSHDASIIGRWQNVALAILLLLTGGCGRSGDGDVDAVPTPPPAEDRATSAPTAFAATPIPPAPASTPTVAAAPDPATIPIIDAHFHADAAWDLEVLVRLLDALNVNVAGNGAKGSDALALQYVAAHPRRFFAFARMGEVHAANLAQGSRSWDLQDPAVVGHIENLERGLREGCWQGIGEIFVNTLSSHVSNKVRQPADSALMRRLWSLSAAYRVPLSVHMDADAGSVAEMERLLASDRDGVWIWAHAGWFASPDLLRRLLQTHPNLVAELSFRDSLRSFAPVDASGRLLPAWRDLIEEMPDRFLIGTDILAATDANYAALITLWRGVLRQLSPDAAVKLAYENAGRVLNLSPDGQSADTARRCLALGV